MDSSVFFVLCQILSDVHLVFPRSVSKFMFGLSLFLDFSLGSALGLSSESSFFVIFFLPHFIFYPTCTINLVKICFKNRAQTAQMRHKFSLQPSIRTSKKRWLMNWLLSVLSGENGEEENGRSYYVYSRKIHSIHCGGKGNGALW